MAEVLADADGVMIPGGFGSRGTEGKIAAIQYARENNLPHSLVFVRYAFQLSNLLVTS